MINYIENLTQEEKDNIYLDILYGAVWNNERRKWEKQIKVNPSFLEGEPIVVMDTELNKPIIYLWTEETEMLIIYMWYATKDCLSVRKRPDGYLGFQSISGLDTRLSEHRLDQKIYEEFKNKGRDLEKTAIEKTDWNNTKNSLFIQEKSKKESK
jgi:hypothetical protein